MASRTGGRRAAAAVLVAVLTVGSSACRDDERALKRAEAKVVAALPAGAIVVGPGVGNREGSYRSRVYEAVGERDQVERQICARLESRNINCGVSGLDPANQVHVDLGARYYVNINFQPAAAGKTRFEVFTYIED